MQEAQYLLENMPARHAPRLLFMLGIAFVGHIGCTPPKFNDPAPGKQADPASHVPVHDAGSKLDSGQAAGAGKDAATAVDAGVPTEAGSIVDAAPLMDAQTVVEHPPASPPDAGSEPDSGLALRDAGFTCDVRNAGDSDPDSDSNCDGIDDDCDGKQDEAFVITESTCGKGNCAASGVITCFAGTSNDNCTPLAADNRDDCGNGDEDCDGDLDEDCCHPRSCTDQGIICGGAQDGCGKFLPCGICPDQKMCVNGGKICL
jgi:hypothetical protein